TQITKSAATVGACATQQTGQVARKPADFNVCFSPIEISRSTLNHLAMVGHGSEQHRPVESIKVGSDSLKHTTPSSRDLRFKQQMHPTVQVTPDHRPINRQRFHQQLRHPQITPTKAQNFGSR
ncbi:hypothetical protein ACLOJK_015227, partial [Asimina triloba]